MRLQSSKMTSQRPHAVPVSEETETRPKVFTDDWLLFSSNFCSFCGFDMKKDAHAMKGSTLCTPWCRQKHAPLVRPGKSAADTSRFWAAQTCKEAGQEF